MLENHLTTCLENAEFEKGEIRVGIQSDRGEEKQVTIFVRR